MKQVNRYVELLERYYRVHRNGVKFKRYQLVTYLYVISINIYVSNEL